MNWKRKKQLISARPNAKAKSRAMAQGICELLWLKIILEGICELLWLKIILEGICEPLWLKIILEGCP